MFMASGGGNGGLYVNVMFLLPTSTRYVALADCVLAQATCPRSGHRWSRSRSRCPVCGCSQGQALAIGGARRGRAAVCAAGRSGVADGGNRSANGSDDGSAAIDAPAAASSSDAAAAVAVAASGRAPATPAAAAVATRGHVGRIRLPRFVSMLQFSVRLRFPSRAPCP
jgi:hypothetical protein